MLAKTLFLASLLAGALVPGTTLHAGVLAGPIVNGANYHTYYLLTASSWTSGPI